MIEKSAMFHTGSVSGAGTAYPSGAHEITPGFYWRSLFITLSKATKTYGKDMR
jgi:hypothetical protein